MAPKVSENLQKAATLVTNAGGDPQSFAQFLGSLSPSEQSNIVDLIVNNDNLARFWAKRFPSSGMNAYHEAETAFGFTEQLAAQKSSTELQLPLIGGTTNIDNSMFGDQGVMTGKADGMKAKRLENGVIIIWDPNDPTVNPEVRYPNDRKAQIAGSRQWLNKVEEKWDDKTVEKWREKLSNLGYTVPEEGGWDEDFGKVLAYAYKDFYANGQKWKQQSQPAGADSAAGDLKMEDLYDPAQARQAVRAKYQQMFGDLPTDKELEEWTGFIEGEARRMARKNKGSTAGLAARFEEKIEADPVAQQFQEQANELEQNTALADGILSIAQMTSR